jgi:hypothetical protein
MALQQGDQIRRIFASWAIINFGQFFAEITEIAQILNYFFSTDIHMYLLNLTKNGLGFILGDFFRQAHLFTLLWKQVHQDGRWRAPSDE